MTKAALLGVLLAAATTISATAPSTPAAKRQFMAQFVVTAQKEGKPVVVAQPRLVVNDGVEGNFLAGGEAPIDLGGLQPDIAPFGISATVKVHEITPDQLRVSVRFGQGDLESRGKDDFIIRESAIRCVRTVKPGETIEAKLNDGRVVKATITPITTK